jgi:dolichyl-phosphate-mannose--protein O-mannosyl transferase
MTAGTQESIWSGRDWAALLAVTAVASLRFVRLTDPDALVFDEAFYVQDACRYVLGAAGECLRWALPLNEVQPPLGKWLIAAGIKLFGYTPLGWRIAAATAGALTVALLYLLARRLRLPMLAAGLASLLLAVDPLHFVHSRIGMLDVFVPLFTTAAFLCCLLDRNSIHRHNSRHPWRLAAGAAAGAAVAVKWPGAFALTAILAFTLWWEFSEQVKAGNRSALGRTVREAGPSLIVAFLLVPILVYVMSYALSRPEALLTGRFWHSFAQQHTFVWQHHAGLATAHAFVSPPWEWFFPAKAVGYFYEFAHLGCREVTAFASPLWLLALLFVGLVLVRAAWRRSIEDSEAVILSGFALSYLPWFLAVRSRSAVVMFYMLPSIPFLYLAVAHAARRARWVVAVWVVLSIGLFALYYPRLSATTHLENRNVPPALCVGLFVLPP